MTVALSGRVQRRTRCTCASNALFSEPVVTTLACCHFNKRHSIYTTFCRLYRQRYAGRVVPDLPYGEPLTQYSAPRVAVLHEGFSESTFVILHGEEGDKCELPRISETLGKLISHFVLLLRHSLKSWTKHIGVLPHVTDIEDSSIVL